MLDDPPALSWADVCVVKDRLRQEARQSGFLAEWRELDRAAVVGTDSLDGWLGLIAMIDEHRGAAASWEIRNGDHGADDDEDVARYRCPTHRSCGRREAVTALAPPPVCRLSGAPMARDDG
ncbi:hypothetical protein ABGB17_08620 [Sphaerisporangium sp. B11E5]|uniref:hypothetical protein n=1 Tax=Sphaerisporangium sp. B11E5 TaxID=3153563 RepID=UPI00325E9139